MKCEVRWKSVMSNSPVFYNNYQDQRASLLAQTVKNLPAMWDTQVHSLGWEDPWWKEWLPTPVFLPGGFHGQRSLAGYSPWGCKELEPTEWLTHTHTHTHTQGPNPGCLCCRPVLHHPNHQGSPLLTFISSPISLKSTSRSINSDSCLI